MTHPMTNTEQSSRTAPRPHVPRQGTGLFSAPQIGAKRTISDESSSATSKRRCEDEQVRAYEALEQVLTNNNMKMIVWNA